MDKLLEELKGIEHGFKHIIEAGEAIAYKTQDYFKLAGRPKN